jgi:hypothetical protein
MNMIPVYPITSQTVTPYIGRPAIVLIRGNKAFYGTLESVDNVSLTLTPIPQPNIVTGSKKTNRKPFKTHNLRFKFARKSTRKIMRIKALTPLAFPIALITGLFVFPNAVGAPSTPHEET